MFWNKDEVSEVYGGQNEDVPVAGPPRLLLVAGPKSSGLGGWLLPAVVLNVSVLTFCVAATLSGKLASGQNHSATTAMVPVVQTPVVQTPVVQAPVPIPLAEPTPVVQAPVVETPVEPVRKDRIFALEAEAKPEVRSEPEPEPVRVALAPALESDRIVRYSDRASFGSGVYPLIEEADVAGDCTVTPEGLVRDSDGMICAVTGHRPKGEVRVVESATEPDRPDAIQDIKEIKDECRSARLSPEATSRVLEVARGCLKAGASLAATRSMSGVELACLEVGMSPAKARQMSGYSPERVRKGVAQLSVNCPKCMPSRYRTMQRSLEPVPVKPAPVRPSGETPYRRQSEK